MARDALAPPPPKMAERRRRLFSRGPSQVGNFAMVQPDRSATITSAALRQIGDETREIRRRRRNISQSDRTWQQEAYDYAKKIGELGYLLNLQSNVIALCNFPLRRWDEDSSSWQSNDPEEDGYATPPVDVMAAFVGPTGDTEELYRRAALNIFTGGETHLLGTAQDTGNGILWEFLSVLELYPNAEGVMVRKRAGLSSGEGVEVLPDDHYTARLWKSAASYSDLAESEVQRVLPICQEIVYLTKMVDATVKSRIPAGMLFIPDELSFAGYAGDADDADDAPADDGEETDPLTDEIFEHMTAPVTDDGSAARLVPLIVRGSAEFGSQISLIDLSRDLDFSAQDLRQEALGRLAAGLDTPPEIMSGRASVNHWTSAIIDQDFIIKHIIPIGKLIANFVTVAYLRPMLEAFENMSPEEAMAWKVEFDPSPVVARADESKSARDLSDKLSDLAIIEANGFTKADMVQEDEQVQRRLWTLVEGNPSVFARLLPMVDGFEDIPIDEVLGAIDNQKQLDAPASDDSATVPPTDDLVDAVSGQEVPDKPEDLALLVERLTTAADGALRRALERAGNRVVSQAQGEQFALVRDRISNARKDRVVSLLTPPELRQFGLTPERLLADAWGELSTNTRAWIGSWMVEAGRDPYAADEVAALAAHELCEAMQSFAADHLIDGFKTQPNGLRVPSGLVVGVLEQSVLSKA